jgi:hypothetical protein
MTIQMNRKKIPDWLLETQNKSWEPEILISGITLTVLFILTSHIYNFFGMLIQDFGVTYIIPRILYIISIIILTGLKIVLILHLVLRGVWTGFVGLSYVFPEGIKREKLPKSFRDIKYEKPETFVIKLERICSLLFSFIFSSIALFLSFFLLYIPMIFLFMSGLNRKVIKIFSLGYSLSVVVAVIIMASLFKTKLKKSKLRKILSNSPYNFTLNMYFTNLGRTRTYLIFALYFLLVILISFSDFRAFKFKNDVKSVLPQKDGIIQLNNDHYETLRTKKLRIPKATIKKFRVSEKHLELFISFYKNDISTVRNIQKNPEFLKKHGFDFQAGHITLPDLYRIKIDDRIISGLRWYEKDNQHSDQRGIYSFIPLINLTSGYHKLHIDKVFLRYRKNKLILIKDWLIIPFEKE